jgi:hypothetical protein
MLSPMAEHLELPRPTRLALTASWNLAESLGIPVAAYFAGAAVAGRDAGMVTATIAVWLTVAGRKIFTRSVPSLLTISALVLSLQAAVVIATGSMLFFLLQFPLANLGLCVLFARTAPTRKPLVAQLAAEVVALKQPDEHHEGLHRFFQGVTWFWAGLFLLLTLGMGIMMVTEPFTLFIMLSYAATAAITLVGAGICVVWFLAVIRRQGIRLRFAPAA